MLSALAAGLFVLVAWECADLRLLRRLVPVVRERPARRAPRLGWLVVAALAAGVVLAGLLDGRRGAALALASGCGLAGALGLHRRGVRRKRASAEQASVARAGEALSGLLAVGAVPAVALVSVAAEHPVLAEAAAEQEIGGDVCSALRRSAGLPGRQGLAELAAAWQISVTTGASMARSIDAIAEELHRRQELASTVAVELAASRAASRLLAVLPVAGIGLGYGFGGDPVAFLTGNPLGQACLVVAVALAVAGLWWTDALADRASR